ncbi:hypothetical protein BSP15_158 [Bacillus phage BSP15]|nr:hypothetical protein BSP15_158 [Bacillus phage BSP15]
MFVASADPDCAALINSKISSVVNNSVFFAIFFNSPLIFKNTVYTLYLLSVNSVTYRYITVYSFYTTFPKKKKNKKKRRHTALFFKSFFMCTLLRLLIHIIVTVDIVP